MKMTKRKKKSLKFVVMEDHKPIYKKKSCDWDEIEEDMKILRIKYK